MPVVTNEVGPDWNPARDEAKLLQLTQSPGSVPSRWVRMMAAELLRLRRGEFVCERCGIRKNGEAPDVDF